MFLDHALQNVCEGEVELNKWLMGYFAQLIQRPWEKPLTALVFKGSKGVGKSALMNIVGHLLGNHFITISTRRHMVGNFNSLFEDKLLVSFEEAFWSGDKAAEGILKELITGSSHVIERKGYEPYVVKNRLRAVIIGNEEWLIPASEDERRFAVFTVGEGRKRDNDFFRNMREGMEAGGYCYLMRYLLDFDLKEIDVDRAPNTRGLLAQKEHSLSPVQQWWRDCLGEGRLLGSDVDGWPDEMGKERARAAYQRYLVGRNMQGWSSASLSAENFSKHLKINAPSLFLGRHREEGGRPYTFKFSTLHQSRADWSERLGHEVTWANSEVEEGEDLL